MGFKNICFAEAKERKVTTKLLNILGVTEDDVDILTVYQCVWRFLRTISSDAKFEFRAHANIVEDELLKPFSTIVATKRTIFSERIIKLDERIRAMKKNFVCAETHGLLGIVFANLGVQQANFVDATGKPDKDHVQVTIQGIERNQTGEYILQVIESVTPFQDTEQAELLVETHPHITKHTVKILSIDEDFRCICINKCPPITANQKLSLKRIPPMVKLEFDTLKATLEAEKPKLTTSVFLPDYNTNLLRFHWYKLIVQYNLGLFPVQKISNEDEEEIIQKIKPDKDNPHTAKDLKKLRGMLRTCFSFVPPVGALVSGFVCHTILSFITKVTRPVHQFLFLDLSYLVCKHNKMDVLMCENEVTQFTLTEMASRITFGTL